LPYQNTIKHSQGEYVALDKVQNTYTTRPVVQQIAVHGGSTESYILAIIIPDPVPLAEIASLRVWKKPVSETDLVTLDEAAKVEKAVKDSSRANRSLWRMGVLRRR